MIFNDDGEDRSSNSSRFFFGNSPRGNAPLLSREGYAAFTSSFFVAWGFFLVFVIWIHLQIKVTDGLVSTISASAVELAALALAVLGILHEFNKEDRWFKLGLLLVGFLFAFDCLLGFYLTISWEKVYELPQIIEITIFGIFAIAFLLGSTTLNRGHQDQRRISCLVAFETRPRRLGGVQRGGGT